MVDRAAPSVVGGHLTGRSCRPLRALAAAKDPLRRRTAITAPLWFVRRGDEADFAPAVVVTGGAQRVWAPLRMRRAFAVAAA